MMIVWKVVVSGSTLCLSGNVDTRESIRLIIYCSLFTIFTISIKNNVADNSIV